MKKILSILMLCGVALAFAACSNSDEPTQPEKDYDGAAIYQNVVNLLYDADGTPAYTPVGDGIYAGQADNARVSYDFIASLIGNPEWDNKDLTVALGSKGELGTLKITGSNASLLERGIYNEIIVDVEDYTPYTLQIITSQQADNGYGEDIFIKRIDSASN